MQSQTFSQVFCRLNKTEYRGSGGKILSKNSYTAQQIRKGGFYCEHYQHKTTRHYDSSKNNYSL